MQPSPEIKYKDKILFPILIVITNAIDLYLTYYEFYFNKKYLFTLFLDTIEVGAAWLAIRYIILQLDKKYPYQRNFLKRVGIQLVLTTVVALAIVILLTELINLMLTSKPVPVEVYTHHIWLFAIWNIIFNGIYIAMYFFQSSLHWQKALQKKNRPEATDPLLIKDTLIVKLGNKTKVLPLTDIRYCTTGNDFSVLFSQSRELFLAERSLDQLESILPASLFFRANRQYIIHRELVQSIESIENGKLQLKLNLLKGYRHFLSSAG
jgi:hypothetical protein